MFLDNPVISNLSKEDILFQGAESIIYSSKFLGYDTVIKYRFRKKYRHHKLDRMFIYNRTRMEVRCLAKAGKCKISCPRVLFSSFDDGIIIMEKIKGTSFDTYIEGINETNLHKISYQIGVLVAKLHIDAQITHSDLTTSNILIVDNLPVLLDFGLAQNYVNIESKAIDLYGFQRALSCKFGDLGITIFEHIVKAYKEHTSTNNEVIKYLAIVQQRGRKRELSS